MSNSKSAGWQFDNTYISLPEDMYRRVLPTSVASPALAIFNSTLAKSLGLNIDHYAEKDLSALFSGNQLPDGAEPIAQAYAGHQFGHFTMLGDGRAILLGEQLTPEGMRFDIQLKGPGITPYSRRGDGRATLSAMLREYIISEAMHFLGIPTTRSLAVVSTGEPVFREQPHMGAVLTRIAASHIRVGTFEYAARFQNETSLKALLQYTIARHYPELETHANPALGLIEALMKRQIKLITEWERVGFIHGVMNTDNMSLSGETIDYGPCAFMNRYHPDTVFSSIDHQGRYAFSNQGPIAGWNLSKFASALLPLIDADMNVAVPKAQEILDGFYTAYETEWLSMMRRKLGLTEPHLNDNELIKALLDWMENTGADYTNTFAHLTYPTNPFFKIKSDAAFDEWKVQWGKAIGLNNEELPEKAFELMQAANPLVIPRNHKVEKALSQATEEGDLTGVQELLNLLQNPYHWEEGMESLTKTPESEQGYKTYCGT
jgi:uncharacterized protein YdiU (UPF0061 family)